MHRMRARWRRHNTWRHGARQLHAQQTRCKGPHSHAPSLVDAPRVARGKQAMTGAGTAMLNTAGSHARGARASACVQAAPCEQAEQQQQQHCAQDTVAGAARASCVHGQCSAVARRRVARSRGGARHQQATRTLAARARKRAARSWAQAWRRSAKPQQPRTAAWRGGTAPALAPHPRDGHSMGCMRRTNQQTPRSRLHNTVCPTPRPRPPPPGAPSAAANEITQSLAIQN
jgi:hypothetical protein